MRRLFRLWLFRHALSHFRWYRRWYGGRWELHYIDVCASHIWLDMKHPKIWPTYRQPCSFGIPTIEDYPEKDTK